VNGNGQHRVSLGKEAVKMWNYEKRLEYPVNITQTNPEIAQVIITAYGGPDGELGASMRYLAQRYTMPYNTVAGVLTDIGVSVPKLHLLFFDNLHVNNIRCIALIPTM
jgi:spore coat protein JC